MTNQQAPEIYTLHTVPNKGERPWSGIYTVRADAEHDAKVLRDATGRDWSVVRLVVADTATTPTGPVARYKIGYHSDEWGVRSLSPTGIYDDAGQWVRYEDHAADRAARAPEDSVTAPVLDYPPLPTTYYLAGGGLHPKTANLVQRFAAALAEKLASAEKKYGYSDGWSSPDWMDECRQKLAEHVAKGDPRDVAAYCAFLWHHEASTTLIPPAQAAESVLEDAARYDWLFGPRTAAQAVSVPDTVFKPLPQDDVLSQLQGFYMSKSQVNALVDAARKQGSE